MFDTFYFHKFGFRVTPAADTQMSGWIGAVLRNNFLHAAENVAAGDGCTFRELLGKINIPQEHPLYSELGNNAPKGIYIAPTPGTVKLLDNQDQWLHAGQWMEFTITLIGRMEAYISAMIDTVYGMCSRGFGHPVVRFGIQEVSRYLPDGNHIPCADSQPCPICLSDFDLQDVVYKKLKIRLNTPTDVINVNNPLSEDGLSYSDLTNGFPSFYLLAKAALGRIEKLHTIYCDEDSLLNYSPQHAELMSFLPVQCHGVTLTHADISWMQANSTPKKERNSIIPLGGHVGSLVFSGKFAAILSYLMAAQHIGIGRNVAFGNGSYHIEAIHPL